MTDLLRTDEAAQLAGITPAAFRKAASNDPALREAKIMQDARTPVYPRAAVEAWRAATPRRVVKASAAVVVAVLGLLLTACGSTDEPATTHVATQAPQVAVQMQPTPEVVETTADCWSVTTAQQLIDRINSMPDIESDPVAAAKYYLALLADLPAPTDSFCTDDDQRLVSEWRSQLVDSIADAQQG